jgi:hypothetical protein
MENDAMTDTAYTAPAAATPGPASPSPRIVRTAIEERIDADAFNDNLAEREEELADIHSRCTRRKGRVCGGFGSATG